METLPLDITPFRVGTIVRISPDGLSMIKEFDFREEGHIDENDLINGPSAKYIKSKISLQLKNLVWSPLFDWKSTWSIGLDTIYLESGVDISGQMFIVNSFQIRNDEMVHIDLVRAYWLDNG